MNPMPYPGPPPAPAAPAKKPKWPIFVGVGCLALVVVCCVLPVGGYFTGNSMLESTAKDTADRFIEAGHRRDSAAVHGMLAGYYAYDATPEGIAAGIPNCPGLSTYTSYDLEVTMLDHPFDNFVSVDVTYHTPTGDVQGSIGIDDGEQVSLYSERGPTLSYGTCDLSAWRSTSLPTY
jgi:hypothetical protein